MEKQRAVNTVTANDEWSQSLMKMYENWMGGDTFQGSNIEEEEIPTGQKQGGGEGAAFTSVGGALPAIEFDKSTGLPTIPVVNTDDDSKKDPKSTSNGAEPPINNQGEKPKYGQQVRDVTLVGANEEKECCGTCGSSKHTTEGHKKEYVNKKVAKIMSYKK